MRAVITGTGMAVPDKALTNADLRTIMDTDDEWISSRTGVRQRRLAAPRMGSSDLAVAPGRAAIEDAGLLSNQVDALITATMTQPYANHDQIDRGLHWPVMDGGGLYRQAVRLMPEAVRSVCKQAGVEVDDIDVVVAHQANERIVEGVRRQLGLAAEKVPSNIASFGNTTSATLPILYHELKEAGRVQPDTLVCFTAFGAGSHWGAVLYREPA